MKKLLVLSFVAITALATATSQSYAITSGVTSALPGVQTVDWSSAIFGSPQPFTTSGGVTGQVSSTGGQLTPIVQSSGWSGNFAPGTPLLWNQGSGPITLLFDLPIFGFGSQIQADFFGPFVARITDNLGNFFTLPGNSTSDADGSAIFVGLLSDIANITSVTFSLDAAANNPDDFAIGGGVSAVPLPAGIPLLAAGLGLLGLLGWRKKGPTTGAVA